MPTTRDIAVNMVRQPFDVLKGYSRRKLRRDVVAGLTVAVVAVPQSMAYALIAGVPPQYGLYTVIIQCFIGSLFNSQPFLSVGPINTQSLLVASAVTRIAGHSDPQVYLGLVIALTLMKGILQIGLAMARMGNLVRYVSQSVIIGFTAGAGVLIAAGQIPNFLGFSVQGAQRNLPGLLGVIERMLPYVDQTDYRAVLLGGVALAIVVVGRWISRMAPGPLLAVVATALIVMLSGWAVGGPPVIGELPKGLPAFSWPTVSWTDAEELFGGALALALLGVMEAFSIGKTIASKTGQQINANQELLSQGFTNFVSSFFQCIPGSGSFSRSALNFYAGAATLYAGVFNAVFVAAIFLLLADQAKYVPLSCLAAVLFVIAAGLVDWRYMLRIARTNPADAGVCFTTFAATLLVPLEFAIYVGVFLNIGLYLRQASRLHIAEMVRSPGGPFVERPIADRRGGASVMFLQLEGDLFFGVADELQDRLTRLANSEVRVIVLRLKRTLSLDSTVLGVLQQFAMTMKERDKHVVLCGVKEETVRRMQAFGLVDAIGQENVFQTQYGVFTSAKQALARARHLVGQSIDTSGLSNEDLEEPTGWSYEI